MRWGLAGYGDLARKYLAHALNTGGNQLMAVWGRNRERAETFAKTHGIGYATNNVDEFLNQADNVYIATPVALHLPIAVKALEKGRNIIIEKPVNAGLYPLNDFLVTAQRSNAITGIAYYRRLFPVFSDLKQKINAGYFGAPLYAEVYFSEYFDPSAADPKYWRTQLNVAGGGVTADAGSHRLDLLCWLFGFPQKVNSNYTGFFPGQAEKNAIIELAWKNGAKAHCFFSWEGPFRDSFRFVFEKNVIHLINTGNGYITSYDETGTTIEKHLLADNPYTALIENFNTAVQTDITPVCSLQEGLMTDAILMASKESNKKQGEWVTLSEPVISFPVA